MALQIPTRTQAVMARIRANIDSITDGVCRISTTVPPDAVVYQAEDNLLAQLIIARNLVHPAHEFSWSSLDPAHLDRIAGSYAALASIADLWVTADQAVESGLMSCFLEEACRMYEIATVTVF